MNIVRAEFEEKRESPVDRICNREFHSPNFARSEKCSFRKGENLFTCSLKSQ